MTTQTWLCISLQGSRLSGSIAHEPWQGSGTCTDRVDKAWTPIEQRDWRVIVATLIWYKIVWVPTDLLSSMSFPSSLPSLRDFFLEPQNYKKCRSLLVQRTGELLRKIWNTRNFKGQASCTLSTHTTDNCWITTVYKLTKLPLKLNWPL